MALPGQITELLQPPRLGGRGRARRARAAGRRRPSPPTIREVEEAAAAFERAADWVRAARPTARPSGRSTTPTCSSPTTCSAASPPTCGPSATPSPPRSPRAPSSTRTASSSSTGASSGPSAPRSASFQRKRYANLSHEPNKAMNLNSYIGLAGGAYREVETERGLRLVPAGGGPARPRRARARLPPDPRRRQRARARVLPPPRPPHGAAASTATWPWPRRPYSSYPGSATRLERLAGATTDLQHISHQGMTHYDATFWVGANAVLRKAAARRHRDDRRAGRLPGPPLHRGPHRHRGHRVEHRPRRPRLAAPQLPGAPQLQRHAAGLRVARACSASGGPTAAC